MKVDPTRRIRPAKAATKTGKAGAGGTGFKDALREATASAPAAAPAPATGVEAVDALLAIQEVDATGGEKRRSQARRRGERLLDRLDEIRMGLLRGGISEARLEEIATLVAERRGPSDDPALERVLDEIELRLKVELAKLGR